MKLKVYSIMDEKAKCYAQPFFMGHDGQAMRAFGDLVNDDKSSICKHAVDYTLWRLAEYDDNSGMFVSEKPVYLAKAVDFKEDAK